MKFDSLGLSPDILKGIQDAGFEHCTPIQEQSLPECLAGKDVIAQSQTGSGKTAVFLLSIFSRLLAAGPNASNKPRALVMVPTRELASQVVDDAVKLGAHIPFRSVAIYGGVEYDKQVGALKTGVDLVVATPGRMIDLYKSKTLSLDDMEIFVIDEADRMFDMGFAPDIMYIAGKLPKNKPRQTMLFSATIDCNVRRLASRYMSPEPVMIEIEPEQVTVNSIDQKIIYVSNEEKYPVLLTLLRRPEVERALIFTNMKSTAESLGKRLTANNVPAKVLTGDVSQEKRSKIIDGMKSGNLKIVVATDVAARGLHIEDVSHVFNYDLPDDAANYVHRIGRTARAGKSGKAYSLACEDHVLNLPEIEKYIERKIENEWIEDSELAKDAAPEPERRRDGRGGKFGERRPFGSRDGGRPPRDGKRRPHDDRKARTHTEKKEPLIEAEKRAIPEKADGDRGGVDKSARPPRRQRGGRPVRKEAAEGRERPKEGSKPEGQRPERQRTEAQRSERQRPDRHRSDISRTDRPRTERPRPGERRERHKPEEHRKETVAPVTAWSEEKPKHQSVERKEPATEPVKEKGGILKRIFKKLLKK
ncbi:MAG: DEAD/DEAH box helicase [Deltaproteobacteria bacterium]|nr:DEAD/DEAH box helicase [Deltaproteobacteria bacterium]